MNALETYVKAIVRFIASAIDAYLRREAIRRGLLNEDGTPIEGGRETPDSLEESSVPSLFEWIRRIAPSEPGYVGYHFGKVGFCIVDGQHTEQKYYFHKVDAEVVCVVLVGNAPPVWPLIMQYKRFATEHGAKAISVSIRVEDIHKPE